MNKPILEVLDVIVIGNFDKEEKIIIRKESAKLQNTKIRFKFVKNFPDEQRLNINDGPHVIDMVFICARTFLKNQVKALKFTEINPLIIIHSSPCFFNIDNEKVLQTHLDKEKKKIFPKDVCLSLKKTRDKHLRKKPLTLLRSK